MPWLAVWHSACNILIHSTIVLNKPAEWLLPLLNHFEWNLHLMFNIYYLLPGLPIYSWKNLALMNLLLPYFCCFKFITQIKVELTSHTYLVCFPKVLFFKNENSWQTSLIYAFSLTILPKDMFLRVLIQERIFSFSFKPFFFLWLSFHPIAGEKLW